MRITQMKEDNSKGGVAMIYSVNFMDLTEKISPIAFAKYLKDTGWELFQSRRTDVRIFQYEKKDDFFQVVIPESFGVIG